MSPIEFLEQQYPAQPGGRGIVGTYDLRSYAAFRRRSYIDLWRRITGERLPMFPMILEFYEDSGGRVGIEDWKRLADEHGLLKRKKRIVLKPKRKTRRKA